MKMKIQIHERKNMVFTGSKILKSIMDTSTPGIDILVRESIQNSIDAVLPEKEYAKISFNYGKFKNTNLTNKIEHLQEKLDDINANEEYNYLAIIDTNTCGLLGEPYGDIDDKNKPHNLNNLVYDFMNGKNDYNAGGSWGIGKSVYYRYGIGLCFYYSRTYENEKYLHKLAGVLIQDETTDTCLLGKRSSGIAFLGDLNEENVSIPIYDEQEIIDFLNVFNLPVFKNDETGTIVVIPYFDTTKILNHRINNEYCPWEKDFLESLKISIQRWYFPRLNNKNYHDKYFICSINNSIKIELNDFFKTLQDLYNEIIIDANYKDITNKDIDKEKGILGKFKYKKFTLNELSINIAPNNLPSPYVMLDIDADKLDGNPGIIFYTRKPGMIINYDIDKICKYHSLNDECFVGIFVLNDDLQVKNEFLGRYIRLTEKANHKEWIDGNFQEFPFFSNFKPFTKICYNIKRILKEEFSHNIISNIDNDNSIYQKKLGEKLMPPEDYGTKPSPKNRNSTATLKNVSLSKEKKYSVFFNGFEGEYLSYSFEIFLKTNENFKSELYIKTNNKNYSFNEWEELGFAFPCLIKQISIDEYYINKNRFPLNFKKDVDNNFYNSIIKKDQNENNLFLLTCIKTKKNTFFGFKVLNESSEDIRLRINILLEPVDLTYSIDFDTNISIGGIQDE